MRGFVRRCLALLCLICAMPALATEPVAAAPAPEAAPQIALITFGPGPVYWERFGHNALLVREPGSSQALLYNYGMFDFGQKDFFLNFARGRMQYRLAVQRFPHALADYADEGRWVWFQELDLPDDARRELARYLAWNAAPENADYRYDYFVANCSTRVRDVLDRALGGALRQQNTGLATSRTFRFEATRLIGPDLILALGMDLGMGPAMDAPIDRWQQAFVPMVLKDIVSGTRIVAADGSTRPLVSREGWLLQSALWAEPAAPPRPLLPFVAIGLLLAAVLVALDGARRRRVARWTFAPLAFVLVLALTLGGLVLLAGWTLTEHWGMYANRNLLLLNPLMLLLLPLWAQSGRADWQPRRWQRVLAVLIALAATLSLPLLLGPGAQQNLPWIALWLPAQLALAWAAVRHRFQSR